MSSVTTNPITNPIISFDVATPGEGIQSVYEGETFTINVDLNGVQQKTDSGSYVDFQEGDTVKLEFSYARNNQDDFATPFDGYIERFGREIPYYEVTLDSNLQASVSIETIDDGINEQEYINPSIADILFEEVVIDSFGNEKTATRIAAYGYVGFTDVKTVEVPVETIREVPVETTIIRTVFKDREVEVIKEVEVPVEVIKEVEVPVEVITEVEVIKTIEVPVGDDLIVGSGKMKGTKRDDFFRSFQDDDILIGKGGDDYLRSGAGDDLLKGGKGNDILIGGTGDDIFYDGKGDDFIELGGGDDMVYLGKGDNVIADFNQSADTLIASGGINWDGNVGTYDNGTVTLLW